MVVQEAWGVDAVQADLVRQCPHSWGPCAKERRMHNVRHISDPTSSHSGWEAQPLGRQRVTVQGIWGHAKACGDSLHQDLIKLQQKRS